MSKATNNTMAMTATNNNMNTLTAEFPLKHPRNERRHFGHPKHPDEAANEILDFVKALAAHGVYYGLTVSQIQNY